MIPKSLLLCLTFVAVHLAQNTLADIVNFELKVHNARVNPNGVERFEVSGARAMLSESGLIARHISVIASNSVHARCSGASLSCLYRREQQSGGASALTNLFAQGSGG